MPSKEELENHEQIRRELGIEDDFIEEQVPEKMRIENEVFQKRLVELFSRYKELSQAEAIRKVNKELAISEETWHPIESVFELCLHQLTGGKGNERHGKNKPFMEQPWKHIADIHGDGFLTGQAAKKLQEAQSFEDLDRWNREMYGVITYTAMAILHRNKLWENNNG